MRRRRPLSEERRRMADLETVRVSGSVSQVTGLAVHAKGLPVPVGSLCRIESRGGRGPVDAEVVGFHDGAAVLMAHGETRGLASGDPVELVSRRQEVRVGPGLLGRVLDGRGQPLDGKGPLAAPRAWPLWNVATPALERPRLADPLPVGIRAIDGLLSFAKGQRVGLFSGSGVGKSVLLGMIARNTAADVTVIGMVGERGRELKDFIETSLGAEGLARSVVVCATSDQPALQRVRAAFVATAIAEFFRSEGRDVLLLMDSLTRMAFAQREIGLAAGEPPATKGYPPSVFGLMPRLLERAGRDEQGSVTGIYTVLVEGDDMADPVADTARGVLDGHVWLSRKLADRGHYPAVDVLGSVSRLFTEVTDPNQQALALAAKRLIAAYADAEDLINIGAYVKGSNPTIDQAIAKRDALLTFLHQGTRERAVWGDTLLKLAAIFPDLPPPEGVAMPAPAAQPAAVPGRRR